MVKQHLKRLSSPNTWPIKRKVNTFITRPNPGPHKMEHQLAIAVILRDILGVVNTTKEVKYVLHNGDCLVDGKVIRDNKRPVGLMDVISLPKQDNNYRVLINKKNKLTVKKISSKEATIKISKVMGKSTLVGGKVQLNTLDGRNFLIEKDSYSIGDSLVVSLPDQKILDHLKLEQGATILLDAGNHVGEIGTVDSVDGTNVIVRIKDTVFSTKRRFAIVIGKDKPIIGL